MDKKFYLRKRYLTSSMLDGNELIYLPEGAIPLGMKTEQSSRPTWIESDRKSIEQWEVLFYLEPVKEDWED